MTFRNRSAPRQRGGAGRGRKGEQLRRRLALVDISRDPRRQRLVAHLHASGPLPVLECLLAVASGQDLDHALEDFERNPADVYRAIGADLLSLDEVAAVKGGRR